MSHLFEPLTLRSLTLRNRIMVSPMCQYSSVDGLATDWHLVHLGARAVGGAGLVCVEATGVEPRGRISPDDLGIWGEQHVEPLARCARFIAQQGAVPAIQLAHAGRKASMSSPWKGNRLLPPAEGGWEPVAPSAIPFAPGYGTPRELALAELAQIVGAFRDAAARSLKAGFQVIELHAAHGYLLHEFLSPLANRRTDAYGGSLANRMRLLLEVADAIRAVWPEQLPLFARLSTTDWAEGGFDVDEAVKVALALKEHGVDLIDCSSGGLVPHAKVPVGPGFQVPAATRIRKEAGIPVAAVGLLTTAEQCDAILRNGEADLVALARQLLRDPFFPLHAAKALGVEVKWPAQYERGKE